MIQELLGAVVEERKLNNVATSFLADVSSPTTSSISSSSPSQSAASSPSSASENLRCPRCDSSNTKFCYYNNYNLTQPRHFCKTCRRYWTKGGALRNVPIGGGCRKTKAAATPVAACKPARPAAADVAAGPNNISRVGSGGVHGHGGADGHDVLLPSSPLLWASCSVPHSSHLLALLRASQQAQQNHSHNLLNYCVKEEAPMSMMMSLDPLANLCNNNSSSLWRNELSSQPMQQYQQQHPQNLFLADAPTSAGIQELYQRLRAPANCGSISNDINQHVMVSNNVGALGSSAAAMATTTTAAAAASVMEPVPFSSGPGEFGYWNPALSWADLSMANGAFP